MQREIFLADHHTHSQDIEFHNESSAKAFNIEVGDHLYPDVEMKKYIDHVAGNNLDTIWMIYEDDGRFQKTKNAIELSRPECKVKGFFFIRDPLNIDRLEIDRLYQTGLLQGIKIHPVIDNYPLIPRIVDGVMQVAIQYNVPVIFHSDDRLRSSHLTSPQYQLELAETYPSARLVIGHGGAYAHPRLVGERNTAAISYWRYAKDLVIAALELTMSHRNVFYESSIVTNKTKASLIVQFVEENPSVSTRIVLGSDFPIIGARLDSQIKALKRAGLSLNLVNQIASNRL